MGASLNPRLGSFDIKMWAETREAWVLLFLLTLSAAAHQAATFGSISGQMWFLIYAHFLYVNAIHKGEECIPSTWDIFYEKWGWMLAYWCGGGGRAVSSLPLSLCAHASDQERRWCPLCLLLQLVVRCDP